MSRDGGQGGVNSSVSYTEVASLSPSPLPPGTLCSAAAGLSTFPASVDLEVHRLRTLG